MKNWGWTKHRNSRDLPTEETSEQPPSTNNAARTLALLQSANYRPADDDVDFLKRSDTRGLRLQLDYLKAELLMEQQGVKHTIVVYGGTRICEPIVAEQQLEDLLRREKAAPDTPSLQADIAAARAILKKSTYYEMARELGKIIGSNGGQPDSCELTLMTGGGPGIMEAANRGAFDVGAKSAGLNISLPREQYPNPYISEELCFSFHYFAIRKLHFILRAKALVVFPGGFGTIDELFGALTLVQTRSIAPLPIVLVGEAYWKKVFNIDFLIEEGVISPEDRDLFCFAETAEAIWQAIQHWHGPGGHHYPGALTRD